MVDDKSLTESVEGPDTERILEVRGLTKSFGATRALADVSLSFLAGEIHCLLGENGAGKSTLGKIVGGLYTADQGEMLFQGRAVSFNSIRDARACGIAVVYQELSLAPDLSVRANLRLGSEGARHPFARLDHKAETEQAKAFLARLGIDIDVEQHVRSFPVAVQQMVEIGKALMQNPRLVIFDEPTAMLGAFEKQKFFDVLRTLRREGVASVLITHHIEDVMDVSDRVSIMRNGKLVDSFAMDRGIDAELVLARLIGKKNQAAAVRLNPFREEKFLQIENGVQANDVRISMSARRGEIIGLYGVVGCGAERIAHGLAGLADVRPWSFVIDGVTFKPRNPVEALRVGVAYLPAGRASNSIFPSRSIRENLNLAQLSRFSKFGLVSHRAERTATEELLRLFRVKYNHADDLITSLSGGNQQKVVLARVIARAEKLLVLEEPTAGIDIETKYEIHERIRELAGKGVTVILVSSDLIETITLCDSVFTMYSGCVVSKYIDPRLEDQAAIIFDVLGQNAIQQPQTEVLDS